MAERSGLARRVEPDSADGGADDERAEAAEVEDDGADDGGDTAVATVVGGDAGDGAGAVADDAHVGETPAHPNLREVSPNPPPTSAGTDDEDELDNELEEDDDTMSAKQKRWMIYAGLAIAGFVGGYIVAAATETPVEGAIARRF